MTTKTNTIAKQFDKLGQLLRSSLPAQLTVIALILSLFSVFMWYRFIFLDTQNVFNGMLRQSLRTTSVTKSVNQEAQGTKLQQSTQLQFGEQAFARGRTVLEQSSGDKKNTVITETIGTPNADFVRYSDIAVSGNDDLQRQYEAVKGVWGKSDDVDGATSSRYFLEAVFNIVPLVNIQPNDQAELLRYLDQNDVYTIDATNSVKVETIQGKQAYVYAVKIKPQPYITYLQKIAESIGLGDVSGLDPSAYAQAGEIPVELAIDPVSRQLLRVAYPNNPQRTETFSSYGVRAPLTIPDNPIPLSELQSKVQQ